MILTLETGTQVEFLTHRIVQMTLNEQNALTAQLMREVQVLSKVRKGETAGSFLLLVEGSVSQHWIDSLLRKTARISQQKIPIALVFKSQSQILFNKITTHSACRIFSDLREAHDWLLFFSDHSSGANPVGIYAPDEFVSQQ